MSKFYPNKLASLQNEISAIANINGNMTAIQIALDNTLSRDGTSPNQMGADLDMNSNRILNLVDAVQNQEPLTLGQAQPLLDAVDDLDTAVASAQASAEASEVSATASASSATNSSASATAAATSETNAATSETNAATSETNAGLSEVAASNSADVASTSASNASTSETNAATSETNAAASASAASDSADDAAASAASIEGDVDAAAASASAAATSETNAGVSETNAATSETNAATSETNAASSASTATTQAGIATTQAGIATTQAGNASISASAASTSETNAATSETNAATSETNAATSETNAGVSETNAAASASAAATALDTFDDIYLGAKASNPALDNDGNALQTGALYWNTANSELRIYDGALWNAVSAGGGGSGELVDDTSPQLGGDLDLNGHVITGLQIGTDVQAYDADLTTWAGLTPSANFQTMVPHTFAQMRTDLGLVIGTNVQAFDSDLTTWSGITPGTGVGTFLATPTSANLKTAVTDETGSGALVFATSPALTTPTGIVKGDVGLGNVDNTSDTTKNSASATLTNKTMAYGGNTFTGFPTFKINIQTFTSSGTYTPTSGMVNCKVKLVGGGGGSGGADGVGEGTSNDGIVSSGGSGAEYAEGLFTASDIGASKAVTIGAAGSAGNNTGGAGGNGGTSSLGSLITALGGNGGGGSGSNNTGGFIGRGGEGGGVGSSGTGGYLRIAGQDGLTGGMFYNAANDASWVYAGGGGDSMLGLGGYTSSFFQDSFPGAGTSGTGYGSGAGGAMVDSTTGQVGAAGRAGIVIIEEYIWSV